MADTWTTLEAVADEVPNFKRGGTIKDSTIEGWIRSTGQAVKAAMLRRGLSLDPANWPGAEEAASVLELINRYGAAARLAYAVSSQFGSGEWGYAKNLQTQFDRDLKALQDGGYDKLFRTAAATLEGGQQVAVGGIVTDGGREVKPTFTKDQVF